MPEPMPPRPPVREGAVEGAPNPVKPVVAGLLNVFVWPNVPKADPFYRKNRDYYFFLETYDLFVIIYLLLV